MAYTIFGGELRPAVDLTISGKLPVADEDVGRNISHCASLCLPSYRDMARTSDRLAVIGGGPSINDRAAEIAAFDGDVWAINGAWKWAVERGVADPVFLAVDPHPIVATWVDERVKRALLETRCPPEAFEALKNAKVHTFDIGDDKEQVASGHSTATAAPFLGMKMGYRAVTLFGCESSFPATGTHAYMNEDRPELMILECGGDEYLTAPDFYMQAQELSRLIREAPQFIAEKSGGLLRAMVKTPEFSIRWLSQGLVNTLSPVGG